MTSEETQVQPKYMLAAINTLDFRVSYPVAVIDENRMALNVHSGFALDGDGHYISALAGFGWHNTDESNVSEQIPFLNVVIETIFEIFNFDEIVVKNEDGSCALPIAFARTLFTIAAGTARGVCHAKTEGSYLNRFFLPILDAHSIVQDVNGDGYLIVAPNKPAP